MTIYYQKNHWYMVLITFFSLIKKLWPYIIFISIQFDNHILVALLICLLVVLGYSIIKWRNTIIILSEDSLVYKEGAIIKDEMIIPIKSISLIEMQKTVLLRLLRLRKLKIDSLSQSKNTEIYMILKTKELNELYNNLSNRIKNMINDERTGIDKSIGYKISAIHLILLSMLRSNIILGIGILVSAFQLMGDISQELEQEVRDFFINLIKDKIVTSGTMLAILLSLLLVLVVILLVILTFSILATLSKYYKFKIYRKDNYLMVEYGLFNRKSYSVALENIHALKVEQNLINQILNLFTIKCSVVGYGDNVKEDELIFPLCGEKLLMDILDDMVPEFKFNGEVFVPDKKARLRFYTAPVGWTMAFSMLCYFISKELWITFLIVPIVILNRALASNNTEIGYDDNLYYVSYKGFNRKRLYIKKSSTEVIWAVSNPFQLRKKLCNYKIKYHSQKKEDWIIVRNLNIDIFEKIKLQI